MHRPPSHKSLLLAILGAATVLLLHWASLAIDAGDVMIEFDGLASEAWTAEGVYSLEAAPDGTSFVWTSGEVRIRLPGAERRVPLRVQLRLRATRPAGSEQPRVVLTTNGRRLREWEVGRGFEVVEVVVPRHPWRSQGLELGLRVTPTFTPRGDPRELGVILDRIHVVPAGPTLPAPGVALTLFLGAAGLILGARARGIGTLPTLVGVIVLHLGLESLVAAWRAGVAGSLLAATGGWENFGPFSLQYLVVIGLFTPCGWLATRVFLPGLSGPERAAVAPALGITVVPLAWSLWGILGGPVGTGWLAGLLAAVTVAIAFLARSWGRTRGTPRDPDSGVGAAPRTPSRRTSTAPDPVPLSRRHLVAFVLVLALAQLLPLWFTGSAWVPSDSDAMTNAFQATQIKLHGSYPVVPSPEWGPQAEVFIVYPPANLLLSAFVSGLTGTDTALTYLGNTSLSLLLFSMVIFTIVRVVTPEAPWGAVLVPLVAAPHGILTNLIVGGNNLELHALVTGALCVLWLIFFLPDPRLGRILPGALLLAGLYLIAPLFFTWLAYGVILYGLLLPTRERRLPGAPEGALVALLALTVLLVGPWLLSLPRGPWRGGGGVAPAWSVFTSFGEFGALRTCSPLFFGLALLGVGQAWRRRREVGWYLGGTLVLWLALVQAGAATDAIVGYLRRLLGGLADVLYLFLDSWLLFHMGFALLLPILAAIGLAWISRLRPRALGVACAIVLALVLVRIEFDQPEDGPHSSTLANYADAAALRWFRQEYDDAPAMLLNPNVTPRYVANWAPVLAEKPALSRRVHLDLMRKDPGSEWTGLIEPWLLAPTFADLGRTEAPGPPPSAEEVETSAEYQQQRLAHILASTYRIDDPFAARRLREMGFTHLFVPAGLPGGVLARDPAYLERCLTAVATGTLRIVWARSNQDLRPETRRAIDIWPYHDVVPTYIFEIRPR